LGEVEHLGEGEMSFAEAAAGDENAEAGGGMEDVELAGVEAEDVFAGITNWHEKNKEEWPQMNTDEHR
jgi:hypothetical protein